MDDFFRTPHKTQRKSPRATRMASECAGSRLLVDRPLSGRGPCPVCAKALSFGSSNPGTLQVRTPWHSDPRLRGVAPKKLRAAPPPRALSLLLDALAALSGDPEMRARARAAIEAIFAP